MALLPGTRLGTYEVTEQIGAGGMGEVYRARDTKLNRDVALKVLPDAFASDPDRVARFRREAQAVASLNHPNIVTIHAVEEADTHVFLTMELASGRSLADVLPRNGFALDELLRIAIPLVDTIAAAHSKGITHRDLKPANIMLGVGEHEGRVKILDFGLARLAQAALEPAHPTPSPTMTLTGEGRILSTAAYMSPEQAEGKPLDTRSDLFSLGVILYEMATGRRPFTGDTNLSIVAPIIKDTPPSVTELEPALPRDLARLIRRALIKNPDQRYQTARDLQSDLEDLEDLKESLQASTSATRRALPSGGTRTWWDRCRKTQDLSSGRSLRRCRRPVRRVWPYLRTVGSWCPKPVASSTCGRWIKSNPNCSVGQRAASSPSFRRTGSRWPSSFPESQRSNGCRSVEDPRLRLRTSTVVG